MMRASSIAHGTAGDRCRSFRARWLLGLLAMAAVLLPQARPAQAQYVPCPPVLDLTKTKLPEIDSAGGRLKGLVVLADSQRAVTIVKTTPNGSTTECVPQLQRFFQNYEDTGPTNMNTVTPPTPGPTLRASLGDVVELTFLNQIDPLDYGNTIDRWENLPAGPVVQGAGCDSVTNGTGYPKLSDGTFDTMPNCFHGSTTGNLHFHGTHTSPMGTADNVFLGIRPSPRANGVPTVTAASVATDFNTFFANCESKLKANNLLEFPLTWAQLDLPNWLAGQKTMLLAYDAGKPQQQQLWPVDEAQNAGGAFPQYYVGSFPYCFLLPKYPGTEQPANSMVMGQSPGTMWYHAHKHGSTALDVSNGMVGAFIIEDNSPKGYDGFIKEFYLHHPNNRKLVGQTAPAPNWPILQTTMVVNQIAGTPKFETGGGTGPLPFSINGQEVPNVTMYPGEVQLWRIVNGSTISGFYLPALPAGFTWRQTAQDGVQFDTFNYDSRAQRPVFVAPGNRIDLLVQAPTNPGTVTNFPVLVTQGVSQSKAQKIAAPTTPFMTIVLTGTGKAMPLLPAMPPRPSFQNDIPANATNAPERLLNFNTAGRATGASQHTIAIDGGPQEKFEEGPALTIDKLGTVEEWKISNTTNGGIDHPFHIHINPFQVVEVFDPNAPLVDSHGHTVFDNGVAVPLYVFTTPTHAGQCELKGNDPTSWHPCPTTPSIYSRGTNIWWDVFPIPDATKVPAGVVGAGSVVPGYFKMRTKFVDYNGSYVLHCHILAHEDRGMMLQVNLALATNLPHMQHH
jgi:FtsP/CotA-like multicopper oxidase with cupredoxin domain